MWTSTWTPRGQASLLLALVVAGGLGAGCFGPAPKDSAQLTPSTPASTPPTTPPPNLFHSQEVRLTGGGLVLFQLAAEHDSVRFYWTPVQKDKVRASCADREDFDTNHFWVAVWNRTGLTHYEEFGVDWNKPLNLTVRLPDDPPFLVWPGITCFGKVQAEFHAREWTLVDLGDTATRERYVAVVQIRIPAGTTTGEGSLFLTGNTFFIEGGPISGDVNRTGQKYGDLYFYEPNQPTNGSNWRIHVWKNPVDDGWEHQKGETGMPGEYRARVVLSAPYATETIWNAEVDTWRFLPDAFQPLGFQAPFALYERDWQRSAA